MGSGENRVGPLFFQDMTIAKDDHAIAEAGDKIVVRYEKQGAVEFLLKIIEEHENFFARGRIEIAGWLVAQEKGRRKDKGASDGNALTFAAGHFIGAMRDSSS